MNTSLAEDTFIEPFRSGSRAAFDAIYRLHADKLLAWLMARCSNKVSANDVAQETWLAVWREREKFDGVNFNAWLFKIARNKSIDGFRKSAKHEKNSEFIENVESKILVSDDADERESMQQEIIAMKECLESVGGPFVQVLQLRMRDVSNDEIASQLGISPATVYTRANRGRSELRDCIERKLKS